MHRRGSSVLGFQKRWGRKGMRLDKAAGWRPLVYFSRYIGLHVHGQKGHIQNTLPPRNHFSRYILTELTAVARGEPKNLFDDFPGYNVFRVVIREFRKLPMVCYYRYLRFFPSGKFLYKISPDKVKDAVKCMHFRASKADCVFKGDYILSEDGQIEMALLYPGHRYTLVRMRLRLRGTTVGANNRLDVLKILTTGVNATELKNWTGSILELVEGWEEDETHDPNVPAVSHSRGLSPFVFVPFEEADTSVLNLPVEKMDYYVPG